MQTYSDLLKENNLIHRENTVLKSKNKALQEKLFEVDDHLREVAKTSPGVALMEAKKTIHRYEIALDAANENVLILKKELDAHIARHKPFETFYKDFLEKHNVKSTII